MTDRIADSIRDHYLPVDAEAFRRTSPRGRVIVIAPTRAACETIELAMKLRLATLIEREHGEEIRTYARNGLGFGIVAGTGTGKTLAIRSIAEETVGLPLKVGVVNREREATRETSSWTVVIVTTGIARRWFQGELIQSRDTIVVDEIHQTSAELELCLALGKRVGCRFIWLSATVDPSFYQRYLDAAHVLWSDVFDPSRAADVRTVLRKPFAFLDGSFLKNVARDRRGVAVFLPTRSETEECATTIRARDPRLNVIFYHGGEPIRVIRPFLDGTAKKPFVLTMTAAGQSALNIQGLDTVIIYDARYQNVIDRGRNVLTRSYLGPNEILQMAGRVHGRVSGGQVIILTNRELDFGSLVPTPPDFQLGGDSERVALTAAALEIDLTGLDLPVPLDHVAYRRAVHLLEARGIVEDGRLTRYGRDVEAMPVDRPWGEMLVTMNHDLAPFVAVISNVDSLHRMTRDERDLTNCIVDGSDHMTAYQLYGAAVNEHGYVGTVHGLPRHLFHPSVEAWAEERGVLVKALEDIAIGMASIYRTLELTLPRQMPFATASVVRRFRGLLAEIMPLDLVLDERTAWGEQVRVGRGSMCRSSGAVAGAIRYFADSDGSTRGAIEGTNVSLAMIKRYARSGEPEVEYQRRRKHVRLSVVQTTVYSGFEIERTNAIMVEPFPTELAGAVRATLVDALMEGIADHPDQVSISRAATALNEYWRRSGGTIDGASPDGVRDRLSKEFAKVTTLAEFRETRVQLDPRDIVPELTREQLDALPSSVAVRGDRAALDYQIENGVAVARLRIRMGQARRLRTSDLPELDRPVRFTVVRGRHESIRANSLEELRNRLVDLSRERPRRRQRHHRRR